MTTIILNDQWLSFKSEYEIVNIEIIQSKADLLVENKLRRRDVSFFRIGNKNYPSFLKTSKQYKSRHPPPVCNISHIFLVSIIDEISDSKYWNECINNNNNMEKVMFRLVN